MRRADIESVVIDAVDKLIIAFERVEVYKAVEKLVSAVLEE